MAARWLTSFGPLRTRGSTLADDATIMARWTRVDLVLILVVAATIRLMLAPLTPAFIDGDSNHYYQPAYELLTTGELHLPLARQPLYPLFIALVALLLGESLERLAAVQHLLGTGSALLTYLAGRLALGRVPGLMAGLATALSSGQLVYERHVMSETLSTFLLMLATCLLLAGLRRHQAGWFLSGGLVVGLAALARPQAQVLLFLLPIVAYVWRRQWRPVAQSTALVFAGAAVVLVPWMARNHATHGSFTVSGGTGQQLAFRTMSEGRFEFLDRENPPSDRARFRAREELQDAADTVAQDEDKPVTSIVKINAYLERELGLSEAAVDGLLREAAVEAIVNRPGAYASLLIQDTWRNMVGSNDDFAGHWRGRPPSNSRLNDLAVRVNPRRTDEFALADRIVSVYESARLGPLLAGLFGIGLVGVVLRSSWRPGLLLALLALSCQAASAALAFHLTRYQYLTEPLVHLVAFGGLVLVVDVAMRWLRRPAAPAREPTAELRPT